MSCPLVSECEVMTLLGIPDECNMRTRAVLNSLINATTRSVINYLHYDPCQRVHCDILPRLHSAGFQSSLWNFMDDSWGSSIVRQRFEMYLQLATIPLRKVLGVWVNERAQEEPYLSLKNRDPEDDSPVEVFREEHLWTRGREYFIDWDTVANVRRNGSLELGYSFIGQLRSDCGWPYCTNTVKVCYVGGYSDAELAGSVTRDSWDEETLTLSMQSVDASPIRSATIKQIVADFQSLSRNSGRGIGGARDGPLKMERLGDYMYQRGGSDQNYDLIYGMSSHLKPEVEEQLAPYRHMAAPLILND